MEPLSIRTAAGLHFTGQRYGGAAPGAASPPPPAVFLPGLGFTVQCYEAVLGPALAALAAEGHPLRVDALNLPGHGGSDVPAELPAFDFVVDAVAEVLAAYAEPVLVLAHSFGATLSLRLAARHPRRVRGLLLLEPGLRGRRHEPWDDSYRLANIERTKQRRSTWPSRAEAATLRGRGIYRAWTDGVFADFMRSAFIAEADGPLGQGALVQVSVRLACPPWLEAQGYRILPGAEMFDWAPDIRAPAVFLRADGSDVVPAGALEELAALLSTGTVIAVPGTHCFPMEHPQPAAEAVAMGLRILLRHEAGGTAKL